MSIEEDDFDRLYKQYGFSCYKRNESFRVYLFEQGYFNNAEIIVCNPNVEAEVEKEKTDLIKTGYSISVKMKSDLHDVEKDLFNGFFKIKASNERVMRDYLSFCDLQTKKSGGVKYSYVSSSYTVNGNSGGHDIVEDLYNQLYSEGAQLIILEAPAGFGKTCTSYEVSNLIAKKAIDEVPILCELSKNRLARIFNYVLYSEIDSKFSSLSYSLVVDQIIKGKVPLIIDGFDELLSKSSVDEKENTDNAKSMLDTVASLFQVDSNAKVILTSRKSSIFVGRMFDDWIESKVQTCTVSRYQILSPTLSDWIGAEHKSLINEAGLDLSSMANPVLLSFLRNNVDLLSNKDLGEPGFLLEKYLELILNRENERQLLLLDSNEQKSIFQRLAAMMVQLDIVADETEGIKALIEDAVLPKIDVYLDNYKYSNEAQYRPPTEEEFVMKLVHNALLDRVKVNSNNIGFINEFIFGVFIGLAIINKDINIKEVGEQYLSYAITSFGAEKISEVDRLLDCIKEVETALTTEQKLSVQTNLTHKMIYDYVDEFFSGVLFEDSVDYQTK